MKHERLRARARKSVCGSLLLASLLAQAAHAHADVDVERVQVAYAASDAEADDLAQTLRSALDLPRLTSDVRRVAVVDARALIVAVPEMTRPLARIWVDFSRESRAFVYVVDRAWTRTYIRSIPRTPDNAALDCAQVGEIVRGAVQSLQEGAVIGIAIEHTNTQVQDTHATSSPELPPNVARRDAVIGLGALYAVGPRASGELAQGPGLYGYALWRLGEIGLGGMLTLQYQPHRVAGQRTLALLDTFALRAGPLLEFASSDTLAPRVGLAAGADVVHVDPSASAADVDPTAARVLAFPMLALMAGLRARLSSEFELLAALTLDVELVDTRYVRDLHAGTRVIEDPFRVRPSLLLCLGFW